MKTTTKSMILILGWTLSLSLHSQDPLNNDPSIYDDFDASAESGSSIDDPLEGFNRAMFGLNDVLFDVIISPVGKTYAAIVPDPVETGISNFFTNLAYPVRLVGSVLQGNAKKAGGETGKFLLNSTVGIGGIFTPSDNYPELDFSGEDMKQTLGFHGVPNGPYLVLPFLGPTTVRNFVGDGVDRFLDPVDLFQDWEVRFGLQVTRSVNELPGIVNLYEQIQETALDPYEAMKDGYVQRVEALIEE